MDKDSIGSSGENAAANFLKEKGYKILEMNYRCTFGEIDIIASKAREIVFTEVKTRDAANTGTFLPEYSVNKRKQEKLKRLAEYYISVKKLEKSPWRIDIIGIAVDKSSGTYKINHIENAIWEKQY